MLSFLLRFAGLHDFNARQGTKRRKRDADNGTPEETHGFWE